MYLRENVRIICTFTMGYGNRKGLKRFYRSKETVKGRVKIRIPIKGEKIIKDIRHL